jgi:hypothetical protein
MILLRGKGRRVEENELAKGSVGWVGKSHILQHIATTKFDLIGSIDY